jgi:hypothetical protein
VIVDYHDNLLDISLQDLWISGRYNLNFRLVLENFGSMLENVAWSWQIFKHNSLLELSIFMAQNFSHVRTNQRIKIGRVYARIKLLNWLSICQNKAFSVFWLDGNHIQSFIIYFILFFRRPNQIIVWKLFLEKKIIKNFNFLKINELIYFCNKNKKLCELFNSKYLYLQSMSFFVVCIYRS